MNLNYKILGNTIEDYFLFALIFCLGLILKKIISKNISKLLFDFMFKVNTLNGNDFYKTVKKPLELIIIFLFFFLGTKIIDSKVIINELSIISFSFFSKLLYFLFAILIVWLLLKITDFFNLILIKKAEKTKSKL